MKDVHIEYDDIHTKESVRDGRVLSYSRKIHHSGLKEQKVLTAKDKETLNYKVRRQVKIWQEKWKKITKAEEANILTKEAKEKQEEIRNLLLSSLNKKHKIDWWRLKDKKKFDEVKPSEPVKPFPRDYSPPPNKSEVRFTFFDKFSKKSRNQKIMDANVKYRSQIDSWEKEKKKIDEENIEKERKHKLNIAKWNERVKKWEKRKEKFYADQKINNDNIEKSKEQYLKKEPKAILEYNRTVLSGSNLPLYFPKEFELEYSAETKILVVEYSLPAPEIVPKLKEVSYIASRDEFKKSYLPDAQIEKNYDKLIYKTILRVLYEIFDADAAEEIDAVSLNGWVRAVNISTGKIQNSCIVSIQVKKSEFTNVDLRNVDPKACFKSLKGVGSSKLVGIVPIQPILQISKEDKRFVMSHEIVKNIDDATNIAAIDWQDFEHLIRELFEKEFTANGGEVKVTQASRDGGVDAIAFDPDPLRGGKIVIQAKRYTNTVGVSAVRDLYGTILNEGATKGILVTTSDYGPDAYEFARGKPITLLNGSHLLHLLAKHGHKAKIDLVDAKKINSERDNQ